jgi:hypothetical protein
MIDVIVFRTKVYSNSARNHPSMGQDPSGRFDANQRPNDLPSPHKLLTAPPRAQPGRFGAGANTAPQSTEQVPRFSGFSNRSQPSQAADSSTSHSMWNNDQNKKSNFSSGNGDFSNQQNYKQSQFEPMQITVNSRMDENRTVSMNNPSRFSSNNNDNQQSSYEQKRPFGMQIE